jgi:hypothetical protein
MNDSLVPSCAPPLTLWFAALAAEVSLTPGDQELRSGILGAVRLGLDGRTVAIGLFAVVLALVLGAVAGTLAGMSAGALAALAGLVPPAVLAVAVERRQRNIARLKARQEVLRRFAPPKPTGDGKGSE